MIDSYELKHLP